MRDNVSRVEINERAHFDGDYDTHGRTTFFSIPEKVSTFCAYTGKMDAGVLNSNKVLVDFMVRGVLLQRKIFTCELHIVILGPHH